MKKEFTAPIKGNYYFTWLDIEDVLRTALNISLEEGEVWTFPKDAREPKGSMVG